MTSFKISKISESKEPFWKKLKSAREEKGLDIARAARALGLNEKFIIYMESDREEDLPPEPYRQAILKKYSSFLGLEQEKKSGEDGRRTKKEKYFSNSLSRRVSFLLSADKLARSVFILLLLIVCFFYLTISAKKTFSPPKLEIFFPPDNLITEKNDLEISGQTEAEAQIEINSESVPADKDGYFLKKINLRPGLNNLYITAEKKYGKKTTVERRVMKQN